MLGHDNITLLNFVFKPGATRYYLIIVYAPNIYQNSNSNLLPTLFDAASAWFTSPNCPHFRSSATIYFRLIYAPEPIPQLRITSLETVRDRKRIPIITGKKTPVQLLFVNFPTIELPGFADLPAQHHSSRKIPYLDYTSRS